MRHDFLEKICVRVKITGLVHGVLFRASMARMANDEGLAGWVKNVPDGSVEAVLEGTEEGVNKVIEWARRGPPKARVDSLKTTRHTVRNLHGFRIVG